MCDSLIWIVHNKLHMVLLLRNAVASHGFHNVRCFSDADQVLSLVKQGYRPDVIVADNRLFGMSGNDLLTLVEGMCETCRGILLVDSDANPYASRHLTLTEGAAGFHEALVEALDQVTHARYSEDHAL